MRRNWPRKSMTKLFLDAEKNGESTVELKTPHEAKLFQYALYNNRRRSKIGQERFMTFQIGIDLETKTKVTIFKPPEIEFVKQNEKEVA